MGQGFEGVTSAVTRALQNVRHGLADRIAKNAVRIDKAKVR
jgi:hypothetical protein